MFDTDSVAQEIADAIASMNLDDLECFVRFKRHILAKSEGILALAANDDVGRLKAICKSIFGQQYVNKIEGKCGLTPKTNGIGQFNYDLMYMKHFGETYTKVHIEVLLEYASTIVGALGNCGRNVVELEFTDYCPNNEYVKPRENDMETWRIFLSELNVKYPQLRNLNMLYEFECGDCPYFDAAIQPFSALTHVMLVGRFSFSAVEQFIGSNPQIEHLDVRSWPSLKCDHADHSFLWELPADFIERLDSALPNLTYLNISVPCKSQHSIKKSKTHLKNLTSLECNYHGPNTWTPNLLALNGDHLKQLELQLPFETSITFLTENASHFLNLKEISVNGYSTPGNGPLRMFPVNVLREFFASSNDQLRQITIRLKYFLIDGKIAQPGWDANARSQDNAKLQRMYRTLMEDKINGFGWQVSGNFSDVVFTKVD